MNPRYFNRAKKILSALFYYSGLEFVWKKLHPGDKSIPSTFVLWIVGIYIALFGIASSRYENTVGKVENRVSALVAQLSSSDNSVFKNALTNISDIQRSKIPVRPEILKPTTVFLSFFEDDKKDETLLWLKKIIENNRERLNGKYLAGVDFERTYMPHGNFQGSDLWDTNFKESIVIYSNFEKTNLRVARFDKSKAIGSKFIASKLEKTSFSESYLPQASFEKSEVEAANFSNSNLVQANFISAKLSQTNFSNANLSGAFFQKAEFEDVNFSGAILIGANFIDSNVASEDLYGARSLFATILPDNLRDELVKNNPMLFDVPKFPFTDTLTKDWLSKHSKHIFRNYQH